VYQPGGAASALLGRHYWGLHNEAIRLDPKSAGGYNNRGNAWSDRGDLERAIDDYKWFCEGPNGSVSSLPII
jgi:hypothetical protein